MKIGLYALAFLGLCLLGVLFEKVTGWDCRFPVGFWSALLLVHYKMGYLP